MESSDLLSQSSSLNHTSNDNTTTRTKNTTTLQGPPPSQVSAYGSFKFRRVKKKESVSSSPENGQQRGKRSRRKDSSSSDEENDTKGTTLPTSSSSSKASKPSQNNPLHLLLQSPHLPTCRLASSYKRISKVAAGTYGQVYKGWDRLNGPVPTDSDETDTGGKEGESKYVALKKINLTHNPSSGFPITSLREISILLELQTPIVHRNIVCLRDIAVNGLNNTDRSDDGDGDGEGGGGESSSSTLSVFLIFPYIPHTLSNVIDRSYTSTRKSPFNMKQVKTLTTHLLTALSYMHGKNIIHRDIKTSNLLYAHGRLIICDFGLARRALVHSMDLSKLEPCGLTGEVVSLWYRSPELLLQNEIKEGSVRYGEGIDNWSAACVFLELITGVVAFQGKSEIDQVSKIVELLGIPASSKGKGGLRIGGVTIEDPHKYKELFAPGQRIRSKYPSLSNIGVDFVSGLLDYNTKVRASAEEGVTHSFFSEAGGREEGRFMPVFEELD